LAQFNMHKPWPFTEPAVLSALVLPGLE
jgi:hypothetical protein